MASSNKFLGFLSFVAVACVGIALFVGSLLTNSRAVDILNQIAYYSAYAAIVLASFVFCWNQKKLLLWIIWAIAMVFLILGAFVL